MAFDLDSDGFVDMDSVPDEPVNLDLAAEADLAPLTDAAWMRLLAVAWDPAMHDPAVDRLVHASGDESEAEHGQSASEGRSDPFQEDGPDLDRGGEGDLSDPFHGADDTLAEPADPDGAPSGGPDFDTPTDLGS